MTELDLYKFITENNVEWHRDENNRVQDVVILPYIFHLEEFCKIAKGFNIDDGGMEIRLMDGYVAIWMNDLCEHFGIDIDKVFIGDGWM